MSVDLKITGFGCRHNFVDAEKKVHKFSQRYQYIPLLCPRCKEKNVFLYPALNKCKCGCIVAFCSLNDRQNNISLWDVSELIKNNKEAKKDGK